VTILSAIFQDVPRGRDELALDVYFGYYNMLTILFSSTDPSAAPERDHNLYISDP
jgi:hypothetical protein